VLARMWARNSGEDTDRLSSRALASPHAGPTLRYSAGIGAPSTPYQPTPNPSPLTVYTPKRECRLWSMRENRGL
jgi:hypothetical protein